MCGQDWLKPDESQPYRNKKWFIVIIRRLMKFIFTGETIY